VEGVDDFEERRNAAGIVVGAVVDVAERAIAVGPIAVADMIVVSADDDIFVAELRVGSAQHADDVLITGIEALNVRTAVSGRFEPRLF
jgi:hypothetical protein